MKLTLATIGLYFRTADQFITFLQNDELEKAHELTLKTPGK